MLYLRSPLTLPELSIPRPPLETSLPALVTTTPAPRVPSLSVTATPEVVMLPGADVVNVSLPPKVCPWGVGVSICRVLAAAASMKPPLANRVMASARR